MVTAAFVVCICVVSADCVFCFLNGDCCPCVVTLRVLVVLTLGLVMCLLP